MHIVYVCREYPPSKRAGGIGSYIKEMATALVAYKHRVSVVTASDDTRKKSFAIENGVYIIRLEGGNFLIPSEERPSLLRKFRGCYRYRSYCNKIKNTIKELKDVDVIEVADYGAESLFLHEIGIPVMVRLHMPTLILQKITTGSGRLSFENIRHYYIDLKELELIKKSKYITSCSTPLKQLICKQLNIPDEKIKVIYNPCNISLWGETRHIPRNNEVVKIVQAGTIIQEKGSEDLIKACILVHNKTDIHIDLTLIGKNSKFSEILKECYSDYDWIHILPGVQREKLKDYYIDADIVCVSSWWENMPMVCIEAMLCGDIVIGTNVGGISEIITEGENGFLMTPKNPESLAQKIEMVTNMSIDKKRMISDAAIRRIKTAFSTEIIVKQMIDYYMWMIEDYKKYKK